MPKTVLAPTEREESVLACWWYDADRVAELEQSMASDGFLPSVPEIVTAR